MDIKFHCDGRNHFKRKDQFVRAFSYSEYSIEPHNHDFYEMNIVLGGTGFHQIEAATFAVKRGDVFVIPPMKGHAYYNAEHLEVYHILLRKDFIRNHLEESFVVPGFLQLIEIEPFLRQSCPESMFLHLTSSQLAEIERDFKFIEANGSFDKEEFSSLRMHTTLKIIYYLSHLLHEQIEGKKRIVMTKYERQILDTLEYMHLNFSKKITVDCLAARVYLSRSTFLRSFHSVCSCSPIEYLNRYRTKKASELLEVSEMTKTEIAHFCGFYDLSHMERSIKK